VRTLNPTVIAVRSIKWQEAVQTVLICHSRVRRFHKIWHHQSQPTLAFESHVPNATNMLYAQYIN
jgi:hypothetical protein